jgi:hypothetical protein
MNKNETNCEKNADSPAMLAGCEEKVYYPDSTPIQQNETQDLKRINLEATRSIGFAWFEYSSWKTTR